MKEVAVGIIIQTGKILACQRRSSARYPLKWEFPGGKLEQDETPVAALVRELHEELGIHAVVGGEFFRQEWVYPDGVADPGRDGSFRVYYYLVGSFTGEPVNRVFEQIRWVTLSELQALDILEGNREAIALLVKHEMAQHRSEAR